MDKESHSRLEKTAKIRNFKIHILYKILLWHSRRIKGVLDYISCLEEPKKFRLWRIFQDNIMTNVKERE